MAETRSIATDRERAGSWPRRAGRLAVVALCTVLSLGVLSGLARAADDEDGELLDRIVAVVGNDAVMQSELDSRMQTLMHRLAKEHSGPLPPRELLTRQVLERMVLERLQLQLAQSRGIQIDDLTLNETMRDIARRNGLSLEAFRDRLVAEGVDYAHFREQVRNELTIERLRKRTIERKIQVTDQEINDFIASQSGDAADGTEYHVRHILVSVPEGATAKEIKAAREKAEAIRAKALQGEDFAHLAATESDGQNALSGGDLGWRAGSALPSIFARDVSTMDVGEISSLIRSPSGFHIIQLEDRRGGQQATIEQTHARHILIKTDALTSDQQAQDRLNRIRERIANGEDFGKLAKANSDDTGSAVSGGDLGWTSPGDLVPEFEEVMDRLQPGQISEPFKTPFGWHIVQVLDRRAYDGGQDVMRAQAREILLKSKTSEQTELWLRRLRDESYVEYRLSPKPKG